MKPKAAIFDRDGTLFQIDRTMVSHRDDEQRCPMNTQRDTRGVLWRDDPDYPKTDIFWRDNCKCADWASFNAAIPFDNPVPAVVALNQSIRPDWAVIVCSGRNEDFRWPMIQSFNKHDVRADYLFMRGRKDMRNDAVVKREILHRDILPFFDVQFAVDDRPIVCDMWRDEGIPLIQVAQPEDVPVFQGLGGF